MNHKLGEFKRCHVMRFHELFPNAIFESDGFEYAYDLFGGERLSPAFTYGIFTSNDVRYAYAILPYKEYFLYAKILLK